MKILIWASLVWVGSEIESGPISAVKVGFVLSLRLGFRLYLHTRLGSSLGGVYRRRFFF